MSRPWMPLYVADYLADTGHLSVSEHGAYLLLIMHYWMKGFLPGDEKQLARIAKMTDREWKSSRAVIQSFFRDGWVHPRIEAELAEAQAAYERRAKAGSRGGRAANIARTKAEHASSNATSNAAPMQEALPKQPQPQPDSSLRSEDNTVERADDAKPDPALIRDMQRRLFEAGGEALNRTAAGLEVVSTPLAWWKAGFDLDLDVLPVVRSACSSAPAGRIRSWSYFTERIQEAHARRTAAIQPIAISEARASPSRRSSGPLSAVEVGLRMLQENERDQSDHASGILIDLGPAVASG